MDRHKPLVIKTLSVLIGIQANKNWVPIFHNTGFLQSQNIFNHRLFREDLFGKKIRRNFEFVKIAKNPFNPWVFLSLCYFPPFSTVTILCSCFLFELEWHETCRFFIGVIWLGMGHDGGNRRCWEFSEIFRVLNGGRHWSFDFKLNPKIVANSCCGNITRYLSWSRIKDETQINFYSL